MYKRMTLVIVAILIIIEVTAGCMGISTSREGAFYQATPTETPQQPTPFVWEQKLIGTSSISKLTIPEDNVTCYILYAGYGGGISCLRDEVTP
jgi:hypothetical protein